MATATTSDTTPPEVTCGFIGLGVMGFGMAQNLRSKTPKSSSLVICELVQDRRDKLAAETQGLIEVANSPKEVAEKAVRSYAHETSFQFPCSSAEMDIISCRM
jgi:hypothetical protein